MVIFGWKRTLYIAQYWLIRFFLDFFSFFLFFLFVFILFVLFFCFFFSFFYCFWLFFKAEDPKLLRTCFVCQDMFLLGWLFLHWLSFAAVFMVWWSFCLRLLSVQFVNCEIFKRQFGEGVRGISNRRICPKFRTDFRIHCHVARMRIFAKIVNGFSDLVQIIVGFSDLCQKVVGFSDTGKLIFF